MIKLFKPFIAPSVPDKVKEVLLSGELTQGAVVDRFEDILRQVCGTPHVCTVNSATSALSLALTIIRQAIAQEDGAEENNRPIEVLCPPLTCAAGSLSVINSGLDIVWYDLGCEFDNLNLEDIESRFTKNTRILMVVSWGGCHLVQYHLEVLQLHYEKKFGKKLYILCDKAHQPVGEYPEHPSFFSAYSFQAIKHLTTGDGGLLVCPSEYIKRARLMRWFGLDRENNCSFRAGSDITTGGFKYHLNNIAAAIGLANLESPEYKEAVASQKWNIQEIYASVKNPDLEIVNNSTWLLTVLSNNQADLADYLKEKGIECSQVHRRNDQLTIFKNYRVDNLKVMDFYESRYLCLPCGWWLTDKEVNYIVDVLNKYRG